MAPYNFQCLRSLRKQHGMTIEALAKKSGVSFALISKLERNRANPSLDTLQQLARALSMSATELVSLAEPRTRETRTAEAYKADGFSFKRVRFNNASVLSVSAKAGRRLSRPEIHEDDYEVVFVLKGQIRLSTTLGGFSLKAGEAMQFDAVFAHSYEVLKDCELTILHLKKEKRF
jgi:transcriptional regulator with XRE-family HTH domain